MHEIDICKMSMNTFYKSLFMEEGCCISLKTHQLQIGKYFSNCVSYCSYDIVATSMNQKKIQPNEASKYRKEENY